MELETTSPPDNEHSQNLYSEPSTNAENNENLGIIGNPLIQQAKGNLSILLEVDQQPGINEVKAPRIEKKVFKPFKIIRDPIRPQENSKVSKTHNEKLTDSPGPKNKRYTSQEHNKENLPSSTNQLNSDSLKHIKPNKRLTTAELREKYKNLVYGEFDNEEDIECTICLENEGSSEDEIVICDLCNSSFHQSCYGSELLNLADTPPEWFCHRCSYLVKNDLEFDDILCEFCPELKGPIKRIKSDSNKHWAHVVCVNWINEIWYLNEQEKTDVKIEEYWANKSCGRKSLRCMFCEIPYGDCIQCDHADCQAAFHITCAQKRGVISLWKNMLSLKKEDDYQYFVPTYCRKHLKEFNQEMYERSNQLKDKLEKGASKLSYLVKKPLKKKHFCEDFTQKKPADLNVKRDYGTLNKEKASSRPQSPQNIEGRTPRKLIKGGSEKSEKERIAEGLGDDSNTSWTEQKPVIRAKKSVLPMPEVKNNTKETHTGISESSQTATKEFRFRPDVAEILSFDKWADLKQIKKVIEDYMQKNLSYNHDTQEYKLIEGSNLQKILQVPVIKSGQFLKKFAEARCLISNSKQTSSHEKEKPHIKETTPPIAMKDPQNMRKDPPTIQKCQLKDPSNSNKSQSISRESSIASPTETSLNRKSSLSKNNEAPTHQPLPKLEKHKSENLKADRKRSEDNIKPQKISRKTSESKLERKASTDSGQFMDSFFSKPKDNKDTSIKDTASALAGIFSANKTESSSKSILGFVNNQDKMIFRKPMRWFSIGNMQEAEHYDTKTLMELLWPKNAEYLYQ